MSSPIPSRAFSQVSLIILTVVALCTYALLIKAYEVNNWRGFWFSFVHVAVVAGGAWLALRKVR